MSIDGTAPRCASGAVVFEGADFAKGEDNRRDFLIMFIQDGGGKSFTIARRVRYGMSD
jgi:hypothetical protein